MKIDKLVLGSLQTNCYFVVNGGECVVIDPAYFDKKILKKAESLNAEIKAILLTHGHFDHVGAVKKLQELNFPVFATKEDAFVIENDFEKFYIQKSRAFKVDKIIESGENLNLIGLNFKVLKTPGHTKGSCCFMVEDNIFSGDTLFKNAYGRTDLFSGSEAQMQQSLKKLLSLEKDYNVYPGHGDTTTIFEEKEFFYNKIWTTENF